MLAHNPLRRSRVIVESGRGLGEVITAAVDALLNERDGDKRHRAITAAYIKAALTQEAAANRLGMPFSTYRRHLRTGVDRVSDALWHHELTGSFSPLGR